jgi:hypothetical protein
VNHDELPPVGGGLAEGLVEVGDGDGVVDGLELFGLGLGDGLELFGLGLGAGLELFGLGLGAGWRRE